MHGRPNNSHTPEEAMAKQCPKRFGLPTPNCLGPDGCMHWLWGWTNADGFEREVRSSLDWRGMLGDEPDGLKAWLAMQIGDEARAHALANRWIDTPADEYDALEEIEGEINAALDEAYLADDGKKMSAFEEAERPGDEWLLLKEDSGVDEGIMTAVYQRTARRRGFCGLLAAAIAHNE